MTTITPCDLFPPDAPSPTCWSDKPGYPYRRALISSELGHGDHDTVVSFTIGEVVAHGDDYTAVHQFPARLIEHLVTLSGAATGTDRERLSQLCLTVSKNLHRLPELRQRVAAVLALRAVA
jgi:hypothetical protein